jgi:predicted lipoprotein
MLASSTYGAILPTYGDFGVEALALQAAVADWEAARAAGEDGEVERDLARDAWRSAMVAWQRAEVMQLGPAGAAADFTGGLGLRDAIYSWPSVNTCRVDQEIVEQAWDEADFFNVNLVNVTGLDALEYLIFVGGEGNSCAPQVAINDVGLWAAIPPSELDSRRASYSLSLSTDLLAQADALLFAWDAQGDAFGQDLAGAGEEGSSFLDQSAAMDELFASLFYLELDLKDRKLGQPLGLINCSSETCPDALESPHADFALQAARANIEGGLRLYRGGDAEADIGLEELLIHNDYAALDGEIQAAFTGAIAAVDAVENSAAVQLEQDPEVLLTVHSAVKVLTDLLKGEMALALLLEIPQEAANDND